jgi:phosphotransferase system IIB component
MKKGLVVLICLLFTLVIIFPQHVFAADSYDQRCIAGSRYVTRINQPESHVLSQTFKPSKNRLTKISIYLYGTGTGNFHIDLYRGNTYIASTPSGPEPNGEYYVSQSFSEAVAVTPGDNSYKIIPRVGGDNPDLYWYEEMNCYNGGIAYEGANYLNNDPIWDFGFVTFGHDAASPSASAGVSPTASSGQESSQTPGASGSLASMGIVDPNIKAPTNLRYNLKDNAVNLVWDASETAEIDGYNIYRSKDNKDFEFITGTDQNTVTFKDTMIDKNQTYYYFVRTRKGEAESDVSNIVKVEQKENQASAESKLPLWQQILYIIGALLILAGLGYLIYRIIKKKN